jgi:hypothetical protein
VKFHQFLRLIKVDPAAVPTWIDLTANPPALTPVGEAALEKVESNLTKWFRPEAVVKTYLAFCLELDGQMQRLSSDFGSYLPWATTLHSPKEGDRIKRWQAVTGTLAVTATLAVKAMLAVKVMLAVKAMLAVKYKLAERKATWRAAEVITVTALSSLRYSDTCDGFCSVLQDILSDLDGYVDTCDTKLVLI